MQLFNGHFGLSLLCIAHASSMYSIHHSIFLQKLLLKKSPKTNRKNIKIHFTCYKKILSRKKDCLKSKIRGVIRKFAENSCHFYIV